MMLQRLRFVYLQAAALAAVLAFCSVGAALAQSSPAQPGAEFRDCDDCPLMIAVPAGKFLMGADGGEPGRYEGSVHEVTIRRAFAVGVFEVTNAEYAAIIQETDHRSGEN